eukprot:5169-Heterococcus_DN1.PRE.3
MENMVLSIVLTVLVVSKKPISCPTSESNSCCLMRTFTRAPITVKMPPRMPVNTAVGLIMTRVRTRQCTGEQ